MEPQLKRRIKPGSSLTPETSTPSSPIEVIKKLDIYPKTKEEAQKRTNFGTVVTLLCAILLLYLTFAEFSEFFLPKTQDIVSVDIFRNEKYPVNISLDITFHRITCNALFLDVVDGNGNTLSNVVHKIVKTRLDERGTPITMGRQKELGDKKMEPYIAPGYCGSCYGTESVPQQCCNTCNELKTQFHIAQKPIKLADSSEQCLRENELNSKKSFDIGCNIKGVLGVPKVKGNFHVAAGSSFDQPHGASHEHHFHRLSPMDLMGFNCSHEIHELSFGPKFPGLVNPLDGSVSTQAGLSQVKYYLKVVPSRYEYGSGKHIDSNQYSVSQQIHTVTNIGLFQSFPLPGVFFEYEWTSLMIQKKEIRPSWISFLTRVCALGGGIYVVLGIFFYGLNRLSGFIKPEEAPKQGILDQ